MTILIDTLSLNETFDLGLGLLRYQGVTCPSRAGEVLVLPQPVMTVHHNPLDRVLLQPSRNPNHAFHLNEALWMLAGRNDALWLDQFVHDFSTRFAEPNGRIHGAYGKRWRKHFGMDQINEIVNLLKRDPYNRQLVLTMWDPKADLGTIVKDKPCNTHIYFRADNSVLDMTICCRSNDMVWGAYGSNIVHFSMLHEVIAALAEIPLGTLYQFSNNMHGYTSVVTPIVRDEPPRPSVPCTVPMVTVPSKFFEDVYKWSGLNCETETYQNSWFDKVALPVTLAFHHRQDPQMAITLLNTCEDLGWYAGMRIWLDKFWEEKI
jgi:hypothetical protein